MSESSAVISDCGQYRYRLERRTQLIEDGKTIAYFGVNPSTADAHLDDHTVKKWRGFTNLNEGTRFIVGNVFAYRATNVKELAKAEDPIGVDNAAHLMKIASDADLLVPCWGNTAKVPASLRHYFQHVLNILRESGKPIRIFGTTKSGDPLHPLMLSYNTELIEWANPT